MAEQKKKPIVLTSTPKGVIAGFCAIQKAATNFVPTGKFEIPLAFERDADGVPEMIEQLTAVRDAEFDKVKEANPKLKKVLGKVDIGSPELDDEGDETGRVILKFGQKALIELPNGDSFKKTVALVDAKGAHIKAQLKIGSGSVGRCSYAPFAYYNAKDKVVGVTLRLAGFKLIKLVEFSSAGGPSSEAMGFAEDESDADDAFSADDYVGGDDDDQTSGGEGGEDEADF